MKNLIASFSLLVLLIISIFFSLDYLNKKYYSYKGKIDNIEELVINNSWDETYTNCIDFLDNWENDSKIMAIFIHHVHVETIYNDLLRLSQYIKYKDKVDSLAEIHEIKFLLKEILEMEKVNLPNIF